MEENNNPSEDGISDSETQDAEVEDREVDLDQLNDPAYQLREVIDERDKLKEDYLRALADLENFKRRAAQERSELLKYQGEKILIDFLEVMDTFDLALNQEETGPEDLAQGLKMIHKQFNEVLSKWSVVGSSGETDKVFDPESQEAISIVPDDSKEEGTILQVIKRYYHYKDKLIRPGQVIVTKKSE